MKRYVFNVVIKEGLGSFWEAIHGVSGVTEIEGAVINALSLGGFDQSTYEVAITCFEDTNTVLDAKPLKETGEDAQPQTFVVSKDLRDSIVLSLEETLSQPFVCDCNAYQEEDSGTWIHEEDTCWELMEDHISATLDELKKLAGSNE